MQLHSLARAGLLAALLSTTACSPSSPPATDAAQPVAPSTPTAPAAEPKAAAAPAAEACSAKGATLGAVTPGCSAAAAEAAGAAPSAPSEPVHFGATFAIAEETPLAKALATAAAGETAVRVAGTIGKVCQKKGCWFYVRDGDQEVRVTMKDYGFLVPIGSAGRKASIEGVLTVRELSEGQAKHLAEDGGEDPNKVTGPQREYQLVATAVGISG
jgi:hypothetical protein